MHSASSPAASAVVASRASIAAGLPDYGIELGKWDGGLAKLFHISHSLASFGLGVRVCGIFTEPARQLSLATDGIVCTVSGGWQPAPPPSLLAASLVSYKAAVSWLCLGEVRRIAGLVKGQEKEEK